MKKIILFHSIALSLWVFRLRFRTRVILLFLLTGLILLSCSSSPQEISSYLEEGRQFEKEGIHVDALLFYTIALYVYEIDPNTFDRELSRMEWIMGENWFERTRRKAIAICREEGMKIKEDNESESILLFIELKLIEWEKREGSNNDNN